MIITAAVTMVIPPTHVTLIRAVIVTGPIVVILHSVTRHPRRFTPIGGNRFLGLQSATATAGGRIRGATKRLTLNTYITTTGSGAGNRGCCGCCGCIQSGTCGRELTMRAGGTAVSTAVTTTTCTTLTTPTIT